MATKDKFRPVMTSLRRLLARPHSVTPIEVEKAEWSFYISYLKEGMVVFDVGAYIGELTLLFSHFVGDNGQVHAFEAYGANFERLMAVCQAAMRPNIELNHVALADKEGLADLHIYDAQHTSWCSLAERPLEKYGIHVRPGGTEKVATMTIDAYCQKKGISQIDLLKIDVEGAEYQVLLGARKMLQNKCIRCFIFEFGQTTYDMGNKPNDINAYLVDMGYRLRNIIKGHRKFPGRSPETAQFSMHIAMPR